MIVDLVGLYTNVPHSAGFKALNNMLESLERQAVPSEDLVKMARFFLENNYFKFKDDVKRKFRNSNWRKVCFSLSVYIDG